MDPPCYSTFYKFGSLVNRYVELIKTDIFVYYKMHSNAISDLVYGHLYSHHSRLN